MSTSNTPDIDNKKNIDDKNKDVFINIKSFVISTLTLIIFVILYFIASSFVLFGCKIGQSNILPTEQTCFPYEETPPEIEKIVSNIFTTINGENNLSEKISFAYNTKNMKNTLIDILRKYKNKPYSSFITNYFISIIDSLICFNYSSLNVFLNLLNKLPEIIIVLLGPIVSLFYITIIFIIDHLYLVYLWFSQMYWFFQKNTNTNDNSKPVWSQVTLFNTFDFSMGVGLVLLFCIIFWIYVMFALPFLPLITMAWCISSILSYSGTMNNKEVGILSIIKELFKFYKVTITTIITIFIILFSFVNLGSLIGMLCILIVILIRYDILKIGIFKNEHNFNLSNIISDEQAKKICKVNNSGSFDFLYDIIYPQKGGNKILNDIKKLSKEFQKISSKSK